MSAPDLRLGTLFDVHGKTVLITGGGGGLGLMMSAAFVQNGAKGTSVVSLPPFPLARKAGSLRQF